MATLQMKEKVGKNIDNILEAAGRVLSRKGILNATLRDIATEAGISNGKLYYYFKSKDSIFYEITNRSASAAQNTARRIKDQEMSRDELEGFVLSIFSTRIGSVEENRLFFYLVQEAVSGNSKLLSSFGEKYEAWIESAEEILGAFFDIPKSDITRAFAAIMVAVIDGLSLQRLMGIAPEMDTVYSRVGQSLLNSDPGRIIDELQKKYSGIKDSET
ncbi:MAG: TetR/AcrR family transcriptional regulator [Thermodesulfobacteriota bacterium]|nr:TetR/AcrR family transcriptional regulator [Thermodesulfobacteriota bacterium]